MDCLCFRHEVNKIDPKQYEPKPISDRSYIVKSSIMTTVEFSYFNAIKALLPPNYFLLPQVVLSSVIKKISEERFQNELYRIIDFCIVDSNYTPIALIEINDDSHNRSDRRIRDNKVKDICNSANLPFITFWTSYGINPEYIKKRILEVVSV